MKSTIGCSQRSLRPRCAPLLLMVLAVAAAFMVGGLYGSSIGSRTASLYKHQQTWEEDLSHRTVRSVMEAAGISKLAGESSPEQELKLARLEAKRKEVALEKAEQQLRGKEVEVAELREQVDGLRKLQQAAAGREEALKRAQQEVGSKEAALQKAQQESKTKETALVRLQEKLSALEKEAVGRRQLHHMAGRIPKILHHVYIPSGSAEDVNMTMLPHHERWVENCRRHHSENAGWEYKLWNASASEALVAEHYPHFLKFYRQNITLGNEKSDMMRYIVLHRFGGLYLDSDVDCWRESSDMLEGYDVVLQGSHSSEGTGSASIASVPGAPVWMAALKIVQTRNVTLDNWTKSIAFTGPNLLADSLEYVGVKKGAGGLFPERSEVNGLVFKVYPAGTFYLPCQWWQPSCRRKVYQSLSIGMQDLTRLAGMHRFAGSWIPEKEGGKGIVNATEEICNPQPDLF